MQTKSIARCLTAGAAAASSTPTPPKQQASWLLTLPGPANEAVITRLAAYERGNLRLTCKEAVVLVDSCAVRLRMTSAELQQGWDRLQQRFPAVTALNVHHRVDPMQQALAPPSWRSITSTQMHLRVADIVQHMAAAFPSLKHVQLDGYKDDWMPPADPFSQLAGLESLNYGWEALTKHQLAAIATLTGLTQLAAGLYNPAAEDWAALSNMQRLRSLSIRFDDKRQQPMALDLKHLTALSSLKFDGQFFFMGRAPPVNVSMQPPSSLVRLIVDRLPQQPMSPLPHLTKLTVEEQESFGQQQLAQLATSCTSLASLSVQNMTLSVACHNAPLNPLRELIVCNLQCDSQDAQLGKVFPQLQALTVFLLGNTLGAQIPHHTALYEGLAALEVLDVGPGEFARMAQYGLTSLQVNFTALAALPALRTLRLNVAPPAIQSVSLLTKLHTLEWVWRTDFVFGFEPIHAAFNSSVPPARLHTLALSFCSAAVFHHDLWLECCSAWIARESSISTVQIHGQTAHMKANTLAVLASAPNISRIVLVSRGPYTVVPDQEVQSMIPSLALQGTVVVLQ